MNSTTEDLIAFLRSAGGAGDCHPAYVEAMEKAADKIERLKITLENIADGATKSAATSGLGAPIVALLERISIIARRALGQTSR